MANTLNSFRNGASLLAKAFGVGFIDWLDEAGRTTDEAAALGEVLESGLVVAVAELQMSRCRCDHERLEENRARAGRVKVAE